MQLGIPTSAPLPGQWEVHGPHGSVAPPLKHAGDSFDRGLDGCSARALLSNIRSVVAKASPGLCEVGLLPGPRCTARNIERKPGPEEARHQAGHSGPLCVS